MLLYMLAGLVVGLVATLGLVLLAQWLVPVLNGGAGRDAMSQGLLGTLVLVYSAPVLGLIGAVLGYRKGRHADG